MSEAGQKEQLTVRLASDQSEANAAAVASTMTAVVSLLSEAQQGLDANKEFLIKARPFKKGSFEIPLELIVMAGGTMFASHPLIDNILDAIKTYFEMKNRLQGDKVEKRDDTTIVIQDTEINISSITLNLLDPQCPANQDVARALETVEKDETISDIELLRGDEPEPFVKVTRSQFGYYKVNAPPPEPERASRDIQSRETITIWTPDLGGNAKWGFNRKGSLIRATVADQTFMKSVREGAELFAAGDRLLVDLVIHQEFNSTTNDYDNKSYTIKRVRKHEKKDAQQTFLD